VNAFFYNELGKNRMGVYRVLEVIAGKEENGILGGKTADKKK
jgi:hypothetical protein